MSDEFEFFRTVFGPRGSVSPSSQFLQMLRLYSAGEEVVFASKMDGQGYEVLWVAGGAVGMLSVASDAADAPIAGAACAVGSLGVVKLGAEFREVDVHTAVTPSIVIRLSEGQETAVDSGHYNCEAFISALLAQMGRIPS